jgi:hypothetical protein
MNVEKNKIVEYQEDDSTDVTFFVITMKDLCAVEVTDDTIELIFEETTKEFEYRHFCSKTAATRLVSQWLGSNAISMRLWREKRSKR